MSDKKLDRDLVIDYISHSLVNGHAGTEVSYKADTHEIVCSSWCMTEKKRLLPFGKKKYRETENVTRTPVPAEIDTEEALREYACRHFPFLRR